jgi:DNA-binding LacI/PurR family transcriptional regulator
MITIKDIAHACDLSVLTVSRALKGDTIVRERTRQRVKKVARQLGYTPNDLARKLQNGQTKMIAVITSNYASQYVSNMVFETQNNLFKKGFDVMTFYWAEIRANIDAFVEKILGLRFEGVVMCQWGHEKESDFFSALYRRQIPIVMLDNNSEYPGIPFIGTADFEGGKIATEYLISKGHTKIGHIRGTEGHSTSRNRLMGFFETMADANLAVRGEWIIQGDYHYEEAFEAAEKYLEHSDNLPTAVFCANDALAAALIQKANEMGIRIPEDLSVIGFCNETLSQFTSPALTTVEQNYQEVASKGIDVLLDLIDLHRNNDAISSNLKIEVPVKIIERSSVADLKK